MYDVTLTIPDIDQLTPRDAAIAFFKAVRHDELDLYFDVTDTHTLDTVTVKVRFEETAEVPE